MPELPEVQTTVNGLKDHIIGHKIKDVWTDYDSAYHYGNDSIKDPKFFSFFQNEVRGSKIIAVTRKAKNILIHIKKGRDENVILVHMKMTGHLLYGEFIHDSKTNKWSPAKDEKASLSDPYNRFIHFVINLDNGKHVALSDTRKFAKVTLLKESDIENSIHLKLIGPDPLANDFDLRIFKTRLNKRSTVRIKNVLMDQTIIAGVGNIYSDEALWRAGIHPEEKVVNVSDTLLKSLYVNLLKVLKSGIDFGGDSMSDYRNIHGERGEYQEHHQVYRKRGQECARKGCSGKIVRKVVGGRSAHFCDMHQKLSKEL